MGEQFPQGSFEDTAPTTAAPPEQRSAARVSEQSQAVVRLLNNDICGPAIAVMIKNMSTKGVGFLQESRMSRGQQFILEMPKRDSAPMSLLCIAERCERDRTGERRFLIGASFRKVLSR